MDINNLMWSCYNVQEAPDNKEKIRAILNQNGFNATQIDSIVQGICEEFHPSPYCSASDNGVFKTPETIRNIIERHMPETDEKKTVLKSRHLRIVRNE